MLLHLLRNILRVSFASSAVIAPMLILLPVIRKNYTAGWRCFVWLLIALRLLIPLSPALPRSPAAVLPVSRNINITVPRESPASPGRAGKENVRQPAKAPEPFLSPSPAPRKADPDHILPVVWLLGAAFFMLFHLTGYFTLKKSVLRFSKPVDLGHAASIWREVKEEMKISGNIRLLSCCKVRSPMITGFFRPLLLLPDLNYDDAELKLVLKHELIHYRRRDVWYKLLLVCANAAHWFNPLVYLVTAASNKDIEMACDSELVKGSDAEFRKRYSETILSAIHKGSGRQTAFSTYFYGGGKTMKERFSNIFDVNKKLKGVFSFCVIAVVMCFAGASVTYGVSDVKRGGNIDNIALQSAGNTYDLEDGKFVISFGSGESAAVPLAPDKLDRAAYFSDKAVYISDEITAVACGGDKSPVTVLVSPDKGQTWRSCAVGGTAGSDYPDKFIGFITADKGWLLLAGNTAMGHQENRIFMTLDGGKTWREIGNTSGTYARVVTGAGFADENTGFVSFRYDTDINPVVFRTEDKGKTWAKCSLEIPEPFKSVTTYATALSPVFNGAKGVLPVTFRNNSWKGDPVDVTVRYETSDYGKTWTFNEKYNLALVWADAWSTRDGRARFEIMSQKMQAEFRAQQSSPDNYVIRWSSPWVVSRDVSLDGDQAVVTYLYTDSTTAAYKGVERLSFGTENGRTVIAGCRTETDMEEYVDTSGWKPVDTGLY
ncbi:MAG: M56 family metallopeptidase, partial [Bacillota bacterium]|nr:M56 family metallopeptidase [Bacillota bacterium]